MQDIITPLVDPTPWVSSLTYPNKVNGAIWVGLDLKDLKKAIIHKQLKNYSMPPKYTQMTNL